MSAHPRRGPGWVLRRHLGAWRRARRCAVPARMVEEATELRLAGDWARACAAARFDVEPSLVRDAHQAGIAAAVLDDLQHLAPDLLRWHLPRLLGGRAELAPNCEVVLADYRERTGSDRLVLAAYTPGVTAPQVPRIALRRRTTPVWPWAIRMPREYWDVRRTDDLRLRCGDARRTAFFHPDGRRRTAAELPTAPPPAYDAAARLEWATMRWDAGDFAAALATYELVAQDPEPEWIDLPLNPPMVADALARADAPTLDVVNRPAWPRVEAVLDGLTPVLRPRLPGPADRPVLDDERWQRLPDWDLLRLGMIEPAELHPLVHRALFPAAGPVAMAPFRVDVTAPARVRCGADWHVVRVVDGRLRVPHSDDDLRREAVLSAFGARSSGCAAVWAAWYSGHRVPRLLRELRQHVFDVAFHGDAAGVLALLDAGFDPKARINGGSTLLHYLSHLDHEELLPRLLAAGLDPTTVDASGLPPIGVAMAWRRERLIDDLVAAETAMTARAPRATMNRRPSEES
ncbi:hypothetical protein Val02_76140 [Virgisporangium aliadipatigenens]|uniref:Ankyrin repeat domain-containing protein n=1 Tax=Virgisporangium aliadipatigenens TaxID=741659 RepID=A0A8J4DV33_9ACTN|nr:hypothetical protein [Virgisporangium aliadipatigenens]GIJ50728.1 hypothetical protein Val02_76140 [Virgisporangium aliadipatigenens]